ncbi:hypothetical protein MHF_0662 [Mycoplasma haemofelis Ohio2]|uniref:Uncharacterized protein n=1 Tax=Mycoplasma haemofelis (strain Ohio2) TaxID=859194 RepID=F6FI86_MYCHI|nr:hypothetical protein MHF_0662 [Mycoplasma haemofelis Ohio2]
MEVFGSQACSYRSLKVVLGILWSLSKRKPPAPAAPTPAAPAAMKESLLIYLPYPWATALVQCPLKVWYVESSPYDEWIMVSHHFLSFLPFSFPVPVLGVIALTTEVKSPREPYLVLRVPSSVSNVNFSSSNLSLNEEYTTHHLAAFFKIESLLWTSICFSHQLRMSFAVTSPSLIFNSCFASNL